MAAAGTKAARGESIPAGAATIGEKFRMTARRAVPTMSRLRLPFTQWATNAAEIFIASRNRCALRLFDR
jgi:hypothetical protein